MSLSEPQTQESLPNIRQAPHSCSAIADGINGLVLDAELVAVDRSDGNVRLRAFQELSTRARGGVTTDQVPPPHRSPEIVFLGLFHIHHLFQAVLSCLVTYVPTFTQKLQELKLLRLLCLDVVLGECSNACMPARSDGL